jgi:hypothetical protein
LLHAAKLAVSILVFAAMLWATRIPPSAAGPTGVSAQDAAIAKQFADAIESGSAQRPHSPDTLNMRLGFSAFLAKSEGGDCRARLENAQNQLDIARTSQARVALPLAAAREAAADYQIHAGRASCGSSAAAHDQELRAAVESARRAVELYRDEFDAVSMTTMQFNVGVAYHDLGDGAAAVAALQTAIKMDREYGFGKDAEDNYRILLQWNGQPAGTDEVAALMRDFPQRSTALSFGWFDGKADLTLTLEYEQLSEGGMLKMHGTKAAERQVRRGTNGWIVSFEPRGTHYEISNWPNDDSLVQGIVASLTRLAIQFHDFNVGQSGDFAQSIAPYKFDSGVRSDVKGVIELLAQSNVPSRLTEQIRNESGKYGSFIEALVAEAYNIETGTWIGASLEQGVWYDMSVPLSLPLEPGLFVMHQIEFAFTRRVPCMAGSADETCVEIVFRATPDPEELKKLQTNLSKEMGLGHKEALQMSSATYMRLVTEPNTLQFYESDLRRYSYWTTKRVDHPLIEFERTHALSVPAARTP